MIIDYSRIPVRHDAINLCLEQWGRWIIDRPRFEVHPMFRLYQSKARQWELPELFVPGNPHDHLEIERAVCALPAGHRTAIRWAYAYPWVPVNRVRRELGLTKEGLGHMLNDARDMLINRLKTRLAEFEQRAI